MSRKSRHFYERDNFFAREILFLPLLTGKKVNSVQEFVEMKSVLLLVFFICLHNQLRFHNFRTTGNRRTPRNRGTPGPQGNLVPLWNLPGIPGTSMVPVSTRTLGRSNFTVIKSNKSRQGMIACLGQFKLRTSSKILFLSKHSNWHCSCSELALS